MFQGLGPRRPESSNADWVYATVDFRNFIVCFGPRPWHIEIRHGVIKTSTINSFWFETLKLKIRRLKLRKPTVCYPQDHGDATRHGALRRSAAPPPWLASAARPTYLYIYIYIYMFIHTCICIYTYIYIYTYNNISTSSVSVCMHAWVESLYEH